MADQERSGSDIVINTDELSDDQFRRLLDGISGRNLEQVYPLTESLPVSVNHSGSSEEQARSPFVTPQKLLQ